MTPRQMRRMIRHESVITALIGATMGSCSGSASPRSSPAAVRLLGLHRRRRHAPRTAVGSLVVFALAAVAAGVLAAALPARRAGRLNVLSALQYE